MRKAGRLLLLLATFVLTACAAPFAPPPAPTPTVFPQVIEHERPQATVGMDVLAKAGCSNLYQTGGSSNSWNCSSSPVLGKLGCTRVEASALLEGFGPSKLILLCWMWTSYENRQQLQPNSELYHRGGCMLPAITTYILYDGNGFRLINNASDLTSIAVPITSPEAALTYALLMTNLRAWYPTARSIGQPPGRTFHYPVNPIEATHVDVAPGGFLVHLFSGPEPPCSCELHTTSAVDVLVHGDGTLEQSRPTPVIQEWVCID